MRLIRLRFPRLNKNNTLKLNTESINERGFFVELCSIENVLKCSDEEFNRLGNNLLGHEKKYNNVGGCRSAGDINHEVANLSEESKRLLEMTIRNADAGIVYITLVTEVVNEETDEKFYVNTEGYEYARYVGVL